MSADVHCPECGAITRESQDDDGYTYRICVDDDCPRIVVVVTARPADHAARLAAFKSHV